MAVKSRRAYKGAAVSNALAVTLGASDVTITVNTNFSGWDTSGTPFFCVIEPGTTKEEKVCVVYTGTTTLAVVDPAATSGWSSAGNYTAGRGVDNTTAREHLAGAVIYPVFTATEADQANELVSKFASQGSLVYQGASTFSELAVGSANHVLRVNSGATAPEWAQVATASIADNAVSLAKLATAVQAALNPTGAIQAYAGSSAPTGYLLCDGASFSSVTYPDLATVLGDTYGTHSGTTYYLPNLKGKVPVGRDASQTEFDVLGETGGAKTVTLDSTMIPAHVHTIDHDHPSATTSSADLSHTHTYSGTSSSAGSHSHSITISDPGHGHDFDYSAVNRTTTGASTSIVGPAGSAAKFPVNSNTTGITASSNTVADHSHTYSGTSAGMSANSTHSHTLDVAAYTGNSGSVGGGAAHNNLQPYIVVNYIIKT